MSERNQPSKVKKECAADNCHLPTLEYIGGAIVVYSHHHGKKHINSVPVGWIIEQMILDGRSAELTQKLKETK
jgi:hypothetical protein